MKATIVALSSLIGISTFGVAVLDGVDRWQKREALDHSASQNGFSGVAQRMRSPRDGWSRPEKANQSPRRLEDYDFAYWPQYNGKACRTSNGDDGEHRREYYHYEYKSLSWCKEKCYKTNECKAFEYKVEGDYRKCEIWFQEPERFLDKQGYRCWIKGESDDNDSGDGNDGNTSSSYTRMEGQACRTADGAHGADGTEYHKYSQKSLEWCVEKCSGQQECKGFEYMSTGTTHCEIWNVEPTEFQSMNGMNCFVKL
jgi:hypothetical protein